MLCRNSPVYLFYVTGLYDPVVLYGLKCLGLALGYTDDTTMCRRRDSKSSDSGIRPVSILLADKKYT